MNIFGSPNTTTQPLANTGYGSSSTTPSTPTQGKCECASYQDSVTKEPCTPKAWYNIFGGRRRKHSMKRGGSFRPSSDLGVASTASPFSGAKTAQPHNWTGGKRRRQRSSKRRTRRFKCNKCSKRRRHKH
jgi:hypothetical protein